jgi:hypothetical protein
MPGRSHAAADGSLTTGRSALNGSRSRSNEHEGRLPDGPCVSRCPDPHRLDCPLWRTTLQRIPTLTRAVAWLRHRDLLARVWPRRTGPERRCAGHIHRAQRYGGLCSYEGLTSRENRYVIAWGGILAQLALFAAAVAILPIVGSPETQLTSDLLYAMTASNLLLVAINLIPVAPLDGALAWRLVPLASSPGHKRS